MELESVYPSKDRFGLAMQLNALVASPGFQGWMEGEPLDIAAMLYTPEGKPRVTIFSIAHLGDAERMFFVTMLLSAVLGWMRSQPGTTSLRALVYMDEIFGFFPPVANPPSKGPMLTLLKQARAYGVGMVLATQNPVDLDYKGLGNTGTWFIGRLQTERDKMRVLEALEGAMAGSNADPPCRTGPAHLRAGAAGLPDAQRAPGGTHAVHHPLGHVLPGWPLTTEPGPDPDGSPEGRAAVARGGDGGCARRRGRGRRGHPDDGDCDGPGRHG
jgi:hypothetical protein